MNQQETIQFIVDVHFALIDYWCAESLRILLGRPAVGDCMRVCADAWRGLPSLSSSAHNSINIEGRSAVDKARAMASLLFG